MLRFILAIAALGAVACHDPVCQHMHDSQKRLALACGDTPPTKSDLDACDKGISRCTPGDKAIIEDIASCFDLIDGCGNEAPDGGGIFSAPSLSCGFKGLGLSATCREATASSSSKGNTDAGFDAGLGVDAGPASPFSGHFSGSGTLTIVCSGNRNDYPLFYVFDFRVDGATVTFDMNSECTGLIADINGNIATLRERSCTEVVSQSRQFHLRTGTLTAHDNEIAIAIHEVVTFDNKPGSCYGDNIATVTRSF